MLLKYVRRLMVRLFSFLFRPDVPVEYLDPIYKENPLVYATTGSAGIDLRACMKEEEIFVLPGQTVKIPSGVKIVIPKFCVGLMIVRSGKSTHHGLRIANQVAVIDSDYRGEMTICVGTTNSQGCKIKRHERIVQLLIVPALMANFVEIDGLSEKYNTNRGARGFGHTGMK